MNMNSTPRTVYAAIKRFFGDTTSSGQQRRSRGGLVLAIVLLPLLLGVLACFPVPVGDPERSRIDPAMSGIWVSSDTISSDTISSDTSTGLTDLLGDAGSDSTIMVLYPWDKRTWLVSWIGFNSEVPYELDGIELFKGWLTKIKGERFFTWESKTLTETLPEMEPESWWVFRVRSAGKDVLYLDMLNAELDDFEDVKTRRQAERVIRRNLDNPRLFGNPIGYRRVPEADYDALVAQLNEWNL